MKRRAQILFLALLSLITLLTLSTLVYDREKLTLSSMLDSESSRVRQVLQTSQTKRANNTYLDHGIDVAAVGSLHDMPILEDFDSKQQSTDKISASQPIKAPHNITVSMIERCDVDGDPLCERFLSESDKASFEHCKSAQMNGKHRSSPPGPCRFLNGEGKRGPVALVSLPGSGNTWVRGLLEQATGICTGSLYTDIVIRASGMNGECLRGASVLVVKTHHRLPQEWTTEKISAMGRNGDPKWSAAILIVRNPFDAIVSERNRGTVMNGNAANAHTTIKGPEYFGMNPEWSKFVRHKAQFWYEYFTSWFFTGHPTLLVYYDDLKANTLKEVKRMLDFLNFPYSDEVVASRLAASFDKFHRTQHPQFEHFTSQQRTYIEDKLRKSIELLRKNNNNNTFGIEQFLN